MARLADKQAALRNKAERARPQIQVSRFHHRTRKLLDLMAQGRARPQGRPLSERPAAEAGDPRQAQGTSSSISRASSRSSRIRRPNLPKDIQKEILGSMNEASPVGWEEINRDYFRRLTEGGESSVGRRDARRDP